MNARAVAQEAIRYAHAALAAEDAQDTGDLLHCAAEARSATNLALYLDPAEPAAAHAEKWTELAENAADPHRYKQKAPAA